MSLSSKHPNNPSNCSCFYPVVLLLYSLIISYIIMAYNLKSIITNNTECQKKWSLSPLRGLCLSPCTSFVCVGGGSSTTCRPLLALGDKHGSTTQHSSSLSSSVKLQLIVQSSAWSRPRPDITARVYFKFAMCEIEAFPRSWVRASSRHERSQRKASSELYKHAIWR